MALKNKPLAKDLKKDYFVVDSRRLIEEEGFNRREDYGDLEQFAREIKAAGLDCLDPLTCYKKGEFYVILKGHRRARAIKILEKEGDILMVRVLMAHKGFSKERYILDQATGNEGKHFTPWEKAKVLRDLRAMGWDEKGLVEETKWSGVYVKRLLSLADAPMKLINLVRENVISATFAMDAIGAGTVEEIITKSENNEEIREQIVQPDLFNKANSDATTKSEKITKADLRPHNSLKIFRKWEVKVDEKEIPAEKVPILSFVRRILAGELSEDDIINYFR